MAIKFDVTNSEFLEEYQEGKPLLMKGAASVDSFSWQDTNEIFERADVASSDFKLSYDGIRPKHEYTESYLDIGTQRHRLIKPVVYDYLKKGATLIANKLANEPKVDALARQIAEFTGRQTVTSAYAAFGERDSFRAHWDTRDVFVIQLIGRKRWIVYEPSFESPLYMQQSKDVEQQYPCPKEPYMDFILEAGDVFYLPRGWWHNPLPIGEETFHLAVGTFPAYATDYMEWAFRQLPSFVGARKSLSTWDADKENLTAVGRYIDDVINDPDNYRRFMDEFIGATRVESPLAVELFGNPNTGSIPDNTRIRLSANKPHGLADNYLIANGTKLNLDETGVRLIRCIAESPAISLGEMIGRLTDIDADKLRVLVHELCRQDVLQVLRH
ncbi:JmjC domain-containing protein [Pseudomonas sp. UBA2684]|uniref:JmjC domain-containing protein n=1 Tax=Pseudomonas sp. UBA2684 TaxID=1947311 RepID=UPI0025FD4774|nr:cupin domain-containing protein [Pseudomonas sp. UBA2684]|tara:strand:- start:294 stop:1448 length:1155 start_codon:yes stop_codon:yes gene_type:complete